MKTHCVPKHDSPDLSSNSDRLLEYHLPSDLFEDKQQTPSTSVLNHQRIISSTSEGTCGSSPTSSSETFSFSEQDLLCGENNQTLFPSKTSNDYHLQLRGHSPSYPFNYRNNQLPETQTLTLAQSSEQLETNFLDQPNGYYFQSPYHTSQPELIPPSVDCSQDFQLVSVKNLTTFYIENNNQEISGYVSQHECGFSHPLFEVSKNKENELNCSFLLSSGITW